MATNACTNLTSTACFERLFKIDGFNLLPLSMGENDCLKSRCDVDGYEWEIHCYPRRYVTWCKAYCVELRLMFLSEAPRAGAVTASLSCLLVHPRMVGNTPHTEKTVAHVFKRHRDCSNGLVLVQIDSLPRPASPKVDYLTVKCIITVLKEDPPAVATTLPVPASNLHRHFGDLLSSGTGADVTFVVAGESFAAHKAILAARSPVLMAEFFGHMRERERSAQRVVLGMVGGYTVLESPVSFGHVRETSAQRVVVEDMEAAAFKTMLHFIYTDTVPELDGEQEAATMMAQHLLAAADRYGLDRLKVICEGKLSSGVTVETVATTLALSEQHNCSHLKAKCVEFMISTPAILDAVVATEGYKHLEASCPSALTSIVLCMRGRRN